MELIGYYCLLWQGTHWIYEIMQMIFNGSAAPSSTKKLADFIEFNSVDELNAGASQFRILNTHVQMKYLSKHLLNQVKYFSKHVFCHAKYLVKRLPNIILLQIRKSQKMSDESLCF